MRNLRYAVAMSLDGYIAGPNGEYDWIGADPEVDFNATWSQFDTLLMGRRTFELAVQARGEGAFTTFTGVTSIVFSRTLKPQEHPYVTVLPELNADWVRNLKAQSGKDIWLFGGSAPFSTLASSMASRLLSCRCCWARDSIASPSLQSCQIAVNSPSRLPVREGVVDIRSGAVGRRRSKMTHERCPADFFLDCDISRFAASSHWLPTSRNASRQHRRELGHPISGESAPFDTGESAFYPDYVLNPAFSGRLCCC